MENNNNSGELTDVMKEIRDTLKDLITYTKQKDEIEFIPRKDLKSIFKCTDTTVAKIFNRPDFPAIMVGEHKVEKEALKNWCQGRRI